MKNPSGVRKAKGGRVKPRVSPRGDAAAQKKIRKSAGEHKIEATNQQTRWPVKLSQLEAALRAVLEGEKVQAADISLAVVDDATIHRINRQFLQHDEPTDVISFLLEQDGERLDGDILVSADTAAGAAEDFGWTLADELLLYTVHGALHLVGYDDLAPAKKRIMRQKERQYLAKFALKPRYTLDSDNKAGRKTAANHKSARRKATARGAKS